MDTIKFLKNFVKKSEDTNDLLKLFIDRGQYSFGTLFYKKGIDIYDLIDHANTFEFSVEKQEISFISQEEINDVLISNLCENRYGYTSHHDVSNIIIIPIIIHSDIIGLLCLGNKKSDIVKEDIDSFDDLISLTQLIVNKYKLIDDYKRYYSDSTYFSKDLFLANISHEIRTPLNGIVGYNQLLIKTSLSETQKVYINAISECSLQLMRIINDIIDFSQLSSGSMKTTHECFYISEVINNIKHTIDQQLRNKKQTLKIVIDNNVPPFIVMDKQKLIQIVINLLSNAINYTNINGKIVIKIYNNENTLKVEVIDNGIGISEQDQCKLFNSFVQINNSITKTGTGLGLAIAKRLVELLDGKIDVKSCLEEGSTFFFTCKHYPIKSYENVMKKEAEILKNRWVLVVDDLPDNRIQIGDILFELNMNPIICGSAKEAIKLINSNRYTFEIVLIDICMPEIDGVQLAATIKKDRPLLPLVALSSVVGFVDTSNFEYKLNKPINKMQIFNVIYNVIQNNSIDRTSLQHTNNDINLNTAKKIETDFTKKMRILIAEDVLYNRQLIQDMVKVLGYEDSTIVEDGSQAMTLLELAQEEKKPYSVILLDIRMPKVDGYGVIKYINKNIIDKPVIVVVTASVLDEDRNKCKELGVDFFIDKPINLIELKNTLLRIRRKKTN